MKISIARDSLLFNGVRIFLGGVFIFAAYGKILHPMEFADVIFKYQILPSGLIHLTALVLPWLELIIGLCLIFKVWLPGAVAITTGLLMIFISALVFNRLRGLNVHCGCFSTDALGSPATLITVLRDVFFMALSVYLFLKVFIISPKHVQKVKNHEAKL